MKIVLLGAPGAGKGTQADVISSSFNIPTISTGAIIRDALKNETELGKAAKSYMDSGDLVPDEVVIGIIKERLILPDCSNGFILDGFPRTIVQAEELGKMGITIDAAISIEVADEEILRRLTGRRVCASCGASYHIDHKPSKAGENCEKCGTALTIRKDDAPETIKERLVVFHKQTEPLKDFYAKLDKLILVEGEMSVDETTAFIMHALEA